MAAGNAAQAAPRRQQTNKLSSCHAVLARCDAHLHKLLQQLLRICVLLLQVGHLLGKGLEESKMTKEKTKAPGLSTAAGRSQRHGVPHLPATLRPPHPTPPKGPHLAQQEGAGRRGGGVRRAAPIRQEQQQQARRLLREVV